MGVASSSGQGEAVPRPSPGNCLWAVDVVGDERVGVDAWSFSYARVGAAGRVVRRERCRRIWYRAWPLRLRLLLGAAGASGGWGCSQKGRGFAPHPAVPRPVVLNGPVCGRGCPEGGSICPPSTGG